MTLAPRKSHKKSHHVPLPCETKKTKLQPTSKHITLKAITHNKKTKLINSLYVTILEKLYIKFGHTESWMFHSCMELCTS